MVGTRIARSAVAIALAMVGLAAVAGPAAAAPTAAKSDPTHDNGPSFDPRGDITSSSISYDGSNATVTAVVAQFADPTTDPFWIAESDHIDFFVGGDKPGARSFEIQWNAAPGRLSAPVQVDGASRPVFMCDATPTFSAADSSYSATMPASCVDAPAKLTMAVRFWSEGAGGATGSTLSVDTTDTTGFAARPTAAPTATTSDPTHDNGPTFDPRGDITSFSISYDWLTVTVTATVAQFADPITDPFWTTESNHIDFFVGGNRPNARNFNIQWNAASGRLGAPVQVNGASRPVFMCDATPTFDAAASSYSATMPASCVDFPAKVALGVRFWAEGAGGATLSVDTTDTTGFAGPTPTPPTTHPTNPPSTSPSQASGYWMLGTDGAVFPFGNAPRLGSAPGPAVAITTRADGKGYWTVDARGHVSHFGTATAHGGSPALHIGEMVSAISATPSGDGYWLFTNQGRAFAYGDAPFYGDMSRTVLNDPVVAAVATPTGHGYYMVAGDGGVFSFGDARFHGSTGTLRLNKPIVGISPTPDNRGYWLVASDGGVFAFGAPFRGSMGAVHLNQPVSGLVAYGNGYLMVARDGGVFDFSNQPYVGSLADTPPSAPIIGVTAFASH
jgi:hypothetical protein